MIISHSKNLFLFMGPELVKLIVDRTFLLKRLSELDYLGVRSN